ncbi:hypothetical protein V8G54_008517 [Vigna mungo]|uniref:Chaperone DnaJ C-terminal domain-containing protein n=1 Tax=Vigna mungo TaxID=3915 RepID=A0AAQ3P3Y6_VIGMU
MVGTWVLGTNSIRDLCKSYRSIIKTWFHDKKKPRGHNRTKQKPVEDGRVTNGIGCFVFNLRRNVGDHPMSSPRGCCLYRHRSSDSSCFPCIYSSSRNASRKPDQTSSKNYDFMSAASSLNRSGNLRSMPPHLNSTNAGSARFNNPIMYSNSSGMLKPPPIEKKLECTLEELCYGCKKKMKITRDVLTDTGEIVREEELLTINVQPGWRKGTEIKFEGKGNERPGAYREDIVFIISEKRHDLFRRDGDDLVLRVEIPLAKALSGCTILIPLLGGDHMNLKLDDIVHPGYQKIVPEQGMPISKEPGNRGNLNVTFRVVFPTHLTSNQRSEVVRILQDS